MSAPKGVQGHALLADAKLKQHAHHNCKSRLSWKLRCCIPLELAPLDAWQQLKVVKLGEVRWHLDVSHTVAIVKETAGQPLLDPRPTLCDLQIKKNKCK